MTVIKVENLSKLYRLGEVGTGTISHDLNRFFAKLRGREDPFSKIGHINDRTQKAEKGEHVWALKDINFEVQQGEVLGVIGKNGAGKSTLLKLLSRVTAPTTGNIKIKGRIASLLEVGTGFHPEMTGRENIYMNGTIMGMRKKEINQKLDDIVDFAGVAKYIDTPTKRYSSGMSVRLAFAVAAFLEPEILIVDEVLAVGDAEFQKRAIGKMQDISKGEGRTVLFVSHNMASMSKLCTSGVVLLDGTVSFCSTTSVFDAIEYYVNESRNGKDIYINNSSNADIIVECLKFSNSKTGIFKFQDEVGFEVSILNNAKIRGAYLTIKIFDMYQRPIASEHIELTEKSEKQVYQFLIPSQFLMPDNYVIGFSTHIPNIKFFERNESAISFTVEETGIEEAMFRRKNRGIVNLSFLHS